jgi:hypothetical protein
MYFFQPQIRQSGPSNISTYVGSKLETGDIPEFVTILVIVPMISIEDSASRKTRGIFASVLFSLHPFLVFYLAEKENTLQPQNSNSGFPLRAKLGPSKLGKDFTKAGFFHTSPHLSRITNVSHWRLLLPKM